jgi:hypothetical protein
MADQPKDLKPASDFGEVKVIKNAAPEPPKRPAEEDPAQKEKPGKTPGKAEG